MDMGVPRYMVATSIQAVVAQRLVRLVCDNCHEPYAPTPTEQVWLDNQSFHSDTSKHYQKGRGCAYCNQTGFRGRVGVYEILEVTSAVAEAASHADPATFIRAAETQMAGNTLARQAAELAAAGKTTVSEAMRVSNQFDD